MGYMSAPRSRAILFLLLALLIGIHVFQTLAHLYFQVPLAAVSQLFDVDVEGNIPTFYNAFLFFCSSILFLICGYAASGRARWGWMLLGGVMAFLAVDEGSQFHEHFMLVTLRFLGDGDMRIGQMGWLFYAWIIPYVLAAVGLSIILLPWLWHLDPSVRRGLILAGVVYVAGAAGMESIGGSVAEQLLVRFDPAATYPGIPCEVYKVGECFLYADATYVALYTIEETLEMAGLILCIGVLLRWLERRAVTWTVVFGRRPTGQ